METKKKINWWVTFTDRLFTRAAVGTRYEGKTIKRVYECETLSDARKLYYRINARAKREGVTYLNICSRKPYYNSKRYMVFVYPYSDDIWNF